MKLQEALEKLKEIEDHVAKASDHTDPDFYNSDCVRITEKELQDLLGELRKDSYDWHFDHEGSHLRCKVGGLTVFVFFDPQQWKIDLNGMKLRVVSEYKPYAVALESEKAELLLEVE